MNDHDRKTLYVGDIDPFADEETIRQMFQFCSNQVAHTKVIRDKVTNQNQGYGFVEFLTHEIAQDVLNNYNGKQIPGTNKVFRLNWASHGGGSSSLVGSSAVGTSIGTGQYSCFIGDLDPQVTDLLLENAFRQRFNSVHSARVVMDTVTNKSKGYGFVKFNDYTDWKRALETMNGVLLLSRPMRVAEAMSKKGSAVASAIASVYGVNYGTAFPYGAYGMMGAPMYPPVMAPTAAPVASTASEEKENTTVFVGNLDESATELALRNIFGSCGMISSVRITPGQYAFVVFAERASAERAIHTLNGTQIGSRTVRLSWGASATRPKTYAAPASISHAPPPPAVPLPVEVSTTYDVKAENRKFLETSWDCELMGIF